MKTTKRRGLAVCGALGIASVLGSAAAEATDGSSCATWRSYGFAVDANDPAAAGVVGHVRDSEVDQGNQAFSLGVSEKQARYMRQAVAGGCGVFVKVLTRGTTGTLGSGEAEFTGSANISGGAGGSISESGAHPLSECPNTLICQENNEYWFDVGEIDDGAVITITANGTATATAGGRTTLDQATASWKVRHPALVIPIP